ncbi:MAG: dipeptidase [Candidatus Dormibacteraeota bacterium]|nr:dipeptidase [Candidatus Dormibacteraeota bacterium]
MAGSPSQLHLDAVVVDCHSDLGMTFTHPQLGERGTLRGRWIPELREGGVDAQVLAVYTEDLGDGALRGALAMIAAIHREIQLNPDDVELCLTGAAVADAVRAGRIAMVLALEGASALGTNPELVAVFHRLGVRMISLAHFGRAPLADGSGEDSARSRLTRAGVATLAEMERLGVMMDVTHLGVAGVDHVLELATRPVVASHSVARKLRDHHRNLTDEQIRGIAGTGGVVCANAVPGFIDPQRPNVDRMVDHIEHMVEVAGPGHVGIGADFCVELFEDLYSDRLDLHVEGIDGRQKLDGMWAPRQMPLLTEVLLRRGFTESQVRAVLGENLLRLFQAELGVESAESRGEFSVPDDSVEIDKVGGSSTSTLVRAT